MNDDGYRVLGQNPQKTEGKLLGISQSMLVKGVFQITQDSFCTSESFLTLESSIEDIPTKHFKKCFI